MSCATAGVLADSAALLRPWLREFRPDHMGLLWESEKGIMPSLVQNMVRFRRAKASLLHDRVYAMLSISAPETQIPVDYEADFRAVCVDLANKHAMRKVSLTSLLMCATTLRLGHNPAHDLPSWVPDWRATAAILQSDPQRLEDLESCTNKGRDNSLFLRQTSIEHNVLMTDVMLFESKVFERDEPLFGCSWCFEVNNADWLEWRDLVRSMNLENSVVFNFSSAPKNVL